MRILILAQKDLIQMLRDKRTLLFLVAMPVIFTIFMGFAYRGAVETDADPRIPLAVVDPEPDEALNTLLAERLGESQDLLAIPMPEMQALEALQKDEVGGVMLIPAGFSQAALAGETPRIELVAESGSLVGQSLYQLLRVPVSQLMSAAKVARMSALVSDGGDPTNESTAALDLAWDKWEAESRVDRVLVEVAIQEPTSSDQDWIGDNPYNMASPGILVQFAIIGLITSAQILVLERQSRTLQRIQTTTMRPWEIILGHTLAMFVLVVLQTLLLVVFGQLALKVNYLHAALGTLLVSLALGLWVAAMGLLIGTLAAGEQQVILFSMLAMFLFSALGGTWFPLEASGGGFAAVGRLTPAYWAMRGYQNILVRNLGSASTYPSVAVLLGYAAGFFGLAVWVFKRRES